MRFGIERIVPALRQRPFAAIAAYVLLAATVLTATLSGIAGARFVRELEILRPALAEQRPVIDREPTPRMTRRVVLVVIDGLRDTSSHGLPTLDALRRRGAGAVAKAHYPTLSRPNYVSILAGVLPSASGVRTNHHDRPILLDSLMDRVRAAGMTVAIGSDYEVFPRLFLRTRDGSHDNALDVDIGDNAAVFVREPQTPATVYVSPANDARYAPWPGGFADAGAVLVRGTAELVLLHAGTVDGAGHDHGGASAQYREAALDVDRALGMILASIDLQRDTVIVTADHGHTDRGGHGDLARQVVEVPLVLAGAGIATGETIEGARLIDIAPTVAALLGVAAPGHGLGRTLVEALALTPAQRQRRLEADRVRLAVNHGVVADAEAEARSHRAELRVSRGLRAGLAMLLAIAITVVARRRGLIPMRTLVVVTPALLALHGGVAIVLAHLFFSAIMAARVDALVVVVGVGVIATIAHQVLLARATRRCASAEERLTTTTVLAFIGLANAAVPAAIMWVAFPTYTVLPSEGALVAIPVTRIALAYAAANAALAIGSELVWYRAVTAVEMSGVQTYSAGRSVATLRPARDRRRARRRSGTSGPDRETPRVPLILPDRRDRRS